MQNLEIDKLLIDQVLKHTLSQTQNLVGILKVVRLFFLFWPESKEVPFLKKFFEQRADSNVSNNFIPSQSDLTLIYFAISAHLPKHYLYSSVLNEAQGPKDSGGTNYI